MRKLLIVFAKNPVAGKVKTRLAVDIGRQKALDVYKRLLAHTLSISSALENEKVIYYSDYIPSDSRWVAAGFAEEVQKGVDLGERMLRAFEDAFFKQFEHVVIIGSDCAELTTDIIINAFEILASPGQDIVIGPAKDGGYYLLGMKQLHRELFLEKTWSSKYVLPETLKDIQRLGLTCSLLNELRDVDTKDDLISSAFFEAN